MGKKLFEGFFKAPAQMLDKTVKLTLEAEHQLINKRPFKVVQEYANTLGPGLSTGAADDDPSGIATYSQIGAGFNFRLIWLTLFSFPFMSVVQEMCARIGLVTGRGLAGNMRLHYSRKVLYAVTLLLFIANTLNLGADLGAMAAVTKLLFPGASIILLIIGFGLASLLLQIYTTYARYAKILKYLTLALFSYVFTAFAVGINWGEVLRHTLIPSFNFGRAETLMLCAFLGTTISPYLFFWQTSQEVEEEILKGRTTLAARRGAAPEEIKKMRIDVWSGMFFSNLIAFFIIAACAATLFANGITTITTADQAASAIRPFAGELTYFFFAAGIIGTGLLAIPVLAGSSAYAISESFSWRHGLYRKLHQAYSFYGIIIISVIVGVIENLLHIDPIKALLYSAIVNGLIAPVMIFFIVRISGKEKIMGEWKNSPLAGALGWIILILMALSGVAAITSLVL